MKVELIDYTGAGHSDVNYAAKMLVIAKSTRLEQSAETRAAIMAMHNEELAIELREIMNTIRSSWEFVSYTWAISGVTRAFTHQFVRSRHASFAQQAQRAVDMSGFSSLMPSTVEINGAAADWHACMGAIDATYKRLRARGVPAQDARGVLPTNVLTNIMVNMNLRAFADLVGKRDNPRAQGEYTEVVKNMVACVVEIHPWVEAFLYPDRAHTPALDKLLRAALGTASPVDAPEINKALKELDMLKGTWG